MALCAGILLVALWGGPEAPGAAPPLPRTVVIVLENHEFDEVLANPAAPFLNRLARRGALATRYYAVTHPSLPNYLALVGGSVFGITANCSSCSVGGASLAQQLGTAGIPWRAYMGDMPQRCFAGDAWGNYAKRHNPFAYFVAIASRPALCDEVVPATRLEDDLRRRSLPLFAWLSPNLCDAAHDCGLEVADRALAKLVPRLRRRLGPHGLLIVTFDEGTTTRGCCGIAAGGRVMTIAVGPDVPRGTRLRDRYTHYSLLATIEDRYGLPRLRHARGARTLAGLGPAALK